MKAKPKPKDDEIELVPDAWERFGEFVKRIAPQLVQLTADSGFEVCGVLAVRQDQSDASVGNFQLQVGTIRSQIGCAPAAVNAGYASTNTTVHTHPLKRQVRLTAIDMKVRGTPAGKLRVENLDSCRFSGQDYVSPGFLIACDKVMFQSGVGTEKEI